MAGEPPARRPSAAWLADWGAVVAQDIKEGLPIDTLGERATGQAASPLQITRDAASEEGAEGRRRLPGVLSLVPVAVLVLDTDSGSVTFANPLARQLVDAPLPCAVDAWIEAAHIEPSVEPDHPLLVAARGQVVRSAPILVPTAERGGHRVMWVTAAPLPSVVGLAAASLVILLAVDPELLADDLSEVRGRALVAAGLSFTISDPRRPDNPLVWVNPAFLTTTGYTEDEVIGHNCRFLQGPDTDPAGVDELRAAIRECRATQVVLRNYRKDGSSFWNEVSLSPVFDGAGQLTHFVGVQADVTARVEAEALREERVREEQIARERAETVQFRLALLADATESLVASLDIQEALRALADLLVPRIADWVIVELSPESGGSGVHEVVVTSAGSARTEARAAIERLLPVGLGPRSAISAVHASGTPRLFSRIGPEDLRDIASPELLTHYRTLGLSSAVIVPLIGRREVLGTLTLVTSDSGRVYDDDDLQLATDLARRAGLIVDNARLYAREHRVAEALQRSMLPELPNVEGLDIAARYLPGGVGAQVGGDWYDVLALPDGSVGVAIGDVMGHDMAAAAAMGQLRSVLRSYAWQGQSPGQVLDSLDRLVQGLDMAQLATAVFARLLLDEDGVGSAVAVEYANAGHLPAFVLEPDGTVRRLSDAWSVLIGAPEEGRRTTASDSLLMGSTLVLVTDGLVEVRGQDLDQGLDRLDAALRSLARAPSAQALLDGLLEALRAEDADDDIAVLVVRLLAPSPPGEPVSSETTLPVDRTAAAVARRFLRRTLTGLEDETLQIVLLLASELVANAVTHGRGGVRVRVDLHDAVARVEVHDSTPRQPVLRDQEVDSQGFPAEHGRGVFLLENLASRWGSEPEGEGKLVWFELEV